MQTLNIQNVQKGTFCILGNTLCRQAIVAPFIFYYMVEKLFFLLWVGFLLLTQTWQIALNKTTNEMSNGYRLEYFTVDTSVPDDDDEPLKDDAEHKHGPTCGHGKPRKLRNPFDRGAALNCTDFCIGAHDHIYYELHSIPEGEKKAQIPITATVPTVKTALISGNEHMV